MLCPIWHISIHLLLFHNSFIEQGPTHQLQPTRPSSRQAEMATVATMMPSPVWSGSAPTKSKSSATLSRSSSSNSSKKRSHAQSIGEVDKDQPVRSAPGVISKATAKTVQLNRPTSKSSSSTSPSHESQAANRTPTPTTAAAVETYHHIGATSDFEPLLLTGSKDDTWSSLKRVDSHRTFVKISATPDHAIQEQSTLFRQVEGLVQGNGEHLMQLYYAKVNSVVPLVDEDSTQQAHRANSLDPALLAGIYLLASRFLDDDSVEHIDWQRLEDIAQKHFTNSLTQPRLSTIQAGLILDHCSLTTSHLLTSQLTSAAHELGLHEDCSKWNIEPEEKALRIRLAWMLYMQDKWSAMFHGRPSCISSSDWTVPAFIGVVADSAEGSKSESSSTEVLPQLTTLSRILSDVLETFYTSRAQADVRDAGPQGLRVVLERAKPIQIQLKEWFAHLPRHLKMDVTGDNNDLTHATVHLAYFATEIALHRCIIRASAHPEADSYLSHICRSAAKTRLISAMDFVNRLRPSHLESFWPFTGFSHFASISIFGSLLAATSPTAEEAIFYKTRLEEYGWTLSVSSSHAKFLDYALDSLHTNLALLANLPPKPAHEHVQPRPAQFDQSSSEQDTRISYSGLVSPATTSMGSGSS